MGDEAKCRATLKRQTSDGIAQLESSELRFRGDFRLRIPFDDVRNVELADGKLKVAYSDGTATFDLGRKAARWASKIRNPKALLDKLGVRPQHRVVMRNLRDRDFLQELRERAEYVSSGRLVKEVDLIFLGADSLDDLADLPQLKSYLKKNGAVWTVTPKGDGGLKPDDVLERGRAAGLVDVKVVAFSATQTARKFTIPKQPR